MTGAIQERLRQNYDTSAYHMMYAVNIYSCFYLIASKCDYDNTKDIIYCIILL